MSEQVPHGQGDRALDGGPPGEDHSRPGPGHHDLADMVDREIVGRNVLPGRWTFQVIEDYDDTYYHPFRAAERMARERLAGGRRHLYEAEMKERRRTRGHPQHTAVPGRADQPAPGPRLSDAIGHQSPAGSGK